jgi:exo-beta-1,3-glucanase (GH17 family)
MEGTANLPNTTSVSSNSYSNAQSAQNSFSTLASPNTTSMFPTTTTESTSTNPPSNDGESPHDQLSSPSPLIKLYGTTPNAEIQVPGARWAATDLFIRFSGSVRRTLSRIL